MGIWWQLQNKAPPGQLTAVLELATLQYLNATLCSWLVWNGLTRRDFAVALSDRFVARPPMLVRLVSRRTWSQVATAVLTS